MAASAGGIKAGRAFVLLDAVDNTSRVLKQVQGKMQRFADKMTAMGRGMVTKGLMSLAPAALSAKTFANFDDSLRKVEARSSGTAQQMTELRDQAKELGRTTSFTASQVGELQAKLAQKGFDRSQIKSMTGDVMNLARAAGEGSEEDTTIAADLVSGTLRAFQLEAEEAGRVSDVFTTAVNNSNFSLQDLMDGMAKAGPLASSYGLSVEETAATLASMTNLNISAAEAGTAFQSFLARMSKSEFTEGFNKSLQELTGQTVQFRDASGNLRKPLDLLKEIGQVTAGMGTAAKGDLLSQLFGVRQFGKATGGAAGAVDALELLNKLQNESQGQAAKTAKTMDDGLGGSFRKALSAAEGLAISVGEALSPSLTSLTETATEWVGKATEWVMQNKGLVTGVAAVAAGVVGLGTALLTAGAAVNVVSWALGGLITAITVVKTTAVVLYGVLTSPFIAVVAAIGIAVAALWTFSDSFRELMGSVADFLSQKFGEMGDTIQATLDGIVAALGQGDLTTAWAILVEGAELLWLQFVDTLMDTWNNFILFFVEAWTGAIMKFKNLWSNAQASIANGILELAASEGPVGDLFDAVLGVDFDADDLQNAKGDIEAERKRKVAQNEREAAETLEKFKKNMEGADKEREAEKVERKKALDALVEEVKERARISEQLEEEGKKAGEGPAAPGMPNISPTPQLQAALVPSIGPALEAGTVAAAQKAFENAQRDKASPLDEERNELLEAINDNLETNLDITQVA